VSGERIAILAPAADGAYGGTRWPEVMARMITPLEAAGMAATAVDWTTDETLSGYDLVLGLLAWGYHRDGPAPDYWERQVARWQAAGVRLQNPPDVLRWNADKIYLGALADKGAPVVPTVFVDDVTEAAMHDAAGTLGTDRLVVKPRVSASAFRTIRWEPGTPLDGAPADAAMIQPFLPDVLDGGEPSLLYLGGRFSHAVSKRPRSGDFRVQPEFGGIIAPYAPWPDELAVAEAALAAAEAPLLYARVDLVRGLDGRPVLMELELIEPDLFLEYDAQAPAHFVETVRAAARG
jgi:glutathione synthase/RimK-type ligase-like ATP-grasp enzyme